MICFDFSFLTNISRLGLQKVTLGPCEVHTSRTKQDTGAIEMLTISPHDFWNSSLGFWNSIRILWQLCLCFFSKLFEWSVVKFLSTLRWNVAVQTRAGPVLIAVNPFKQIPIYGPDNVQAYQRRTSESSHPHVYMTADSAFKAMVRGARSFLLSSSGL